ncbi:response regulator [Pseudoalteromonas sp. CO342X]|uniref:response regulator n=1 Tax=Pseudoalteromonas sp. CO342X TaxID=1777270 RepID=UPI001023B490|nr:response regulator [Pseudoalteromonas sp. CO342X]RZG13473.1 response regulator [Pseudoalteromonas sp. CO342X]
MKQTYNILWIDDRQNQVEKAQNRVREKLARMGFELELKKVSKINNDSELKGLFKSIQYDLLVVDYKMQQGAKDGSELIKVIRRHCTATDIAFYSSDTPQNLRAKINVDGVYCFNRADLPNQLIHLIETRLNRLLDLNQMRGLYLAAVADFDHLIDEIIHNSFSKISCSNVKKSTIDHIFDTVLKFHQKKANEIGKSDRTGDISDYTHLLTSQPKIELLLKVLNELEDEQLFTHVENLKRYCEDIIQPRNRLAHSMEIDSTGGIYTVRNNMKESKFEKEDFLSLRHKVLNYRDTLLSIKSLV